MNVATDIAHGPGLKKMRNTMNAGSEAKYKTGKHKFQVNRISTKTDSKSKKMENITHS